MQSIDRPEVIAKHAVALEKKIDSATLTKQQLSQYQKYTDHILAHSEPHSAAYGCAAELQALLSEVSGDHENAVASLQAMVDTGVSPMSHYGQGFWTTANAEPVPTLYTLGHYWGIWIMNTLLAWTPLVVVDFLSTSKLRTVLLVVAILWLISACTTARFSQIARPLSIPLFLGGLGVTLLGLMAHNTGMAAAVFDYTVLLFMLTPSFVNLSAEVRGVPVKVTMKERIYFGLEILTLLPVIVIVINFVVLGSVAAGTNIVGAAFWGLIFLLAWNARKKARQKRFSSV